LQKLTASVVTSAKVGRASSGCDDVNGLCRFSEAFLLLAAQEAGLAVALVPSILVTMNLVYAASAYPLGRLADRMDRRLLLLPGVGC
jgi:MFS family permease